MCLSHRALPMLSHTMKKTIADRIKITGTGKLLRRPMGVDHFRSKKTSQKKQRLRKNMAVHHADIRMFKKYL